MLTTVIGLILCLIGTALVVLALGYIFKQDEWISGWISLIGLFLCWAGLLLIAIPALEQLTH